MSRMRMMPAINSALIEEMDRDKKVILYGEDEIKSGKATLKNHKTGSENSVKIGDLENEIKKLLWKYNKSF